MLVPDALTQCAGGSRSCSSLCHCRLPPERSEWQLYSLVVLERGGIREWGWKEGKKDTLNPLLVTDSKGFEQKHSFSLFLSCTVPPLLSFVSPFFFPLSLSLLSPPSSPSLPLPPLTSLPPSPSSHLPPLPPSHFPPLPPSLSLLSPPSISPAMSC